MSTNAVRYDCIVVGSGAGGAAATFALVQGGRRVLLLEKGHALPTDGSTLDVQTVFHEGTFRSNEPWRDRSGRTLVPEEYFALGGKTKWYGAALLRFSEVEFGADPDHDCLAWPIDYAELLPYYDRAECLLGVRTFDLEPQLARLAGRLRSPWQPKPLPLGLSTEILRHPVEARHFDGFASAIHLKSDAQTSFIERIRHAENLEIRTGAEVTELYGDVENAQRMSGVRIASGERFLADQVVLAAGALTSPRLLQRYLRSRGLESAVPGCDLIGRFYKCHLNTPLMAFSPARKTDVLRKTLLVENPKFPHSSVQTLGWIDGEILATQLPSWVPSFVCSGVGSRLIGFWLTTEDGSHLANRVDDGGPGGDLPCLDYDPERTPKSLAEHHNLIKAFTRVLLRLGYVGVSRTLGVTGTAHACGTLISGCSAESSIVDPSGAVHGLSGLYVTDASVFPRSGSVNPSLTVYAWALRVAEGILRTTGAVE